jgi:RND family efflux transporter MFP subunit
METARVSAAPWLRWTGRVASWIVFAAAIVLLLLWLAGRFQPKVAMTEAATAPAGRPVEGEVIAVERMRLPRFETAVGTVRAVHETNIGSRLLARVVEVNLRAGQSVTAGELLVRLDDTDLQARLQQAKAAVSRAEATRTQAAADEQRYAKLVESRSVARQEYEKAATALQSAEADLLSAQQAVKEVEAMLEWTAIRSPIDGTVIDKKVDVGDMVSPGQMLVTLFDPTRMQLVASVREALQSRLAVGQDINVQIEQLGKQCVGTISEIVPEAQTASRAFQVKVTGPCPPGMYSGMFGRLLIPLDPEEVLIVPQRAVRRVGQLELVDVVQQGQAIRRSIRIGRTFDNNVEVLSGLREGEQVVLAPSAAGT